ncbi:beta-ketoacyl synthase N-terminal-like domain-containing protein [Paractinoplanes rishiriensis]|uniref:Beta-ketoacyl synthase-like N-terminal domain-containing protein n=1 Tax=Paractinoplanes rishiriensis TaxID=1050105 RepID=A0A919KBP1_9ACTN|nr:beta-ketoacyl synthase N-terminal-like domain-containing protein [Actinoplanes rishiriensis]GIF02259.1 hypothetical protein Ari01nite_97230 [Actinoplanes rishiriensis]
MPEAVITGAGLALAGYPEVADLLGPVPAVRDDDPQSALSRKAARHKDRATRLALVACGRALTDAGLPAGGEASDRTGVVASSNYGNLDTVCGTVDTIDEHTYAGASPMLLPSTASNVVASWIAITYRLRGANLTLCNGATSGLDAVHWAGHLVRAGRVDSVLVIGVEPGNDAVTGLAGAPAFDGAVAVVVESTGSAAARGATVRAGIGGYARRAELPDAVDAVGRGAVDLWCEPEGGAAAAPVPVRHRLEVGARLGRRSGALGVLQVAAAVAWFGRNPGSTALATCGRGGADPADAAAALILTAPAGPS